MRKSLAVFGTSSGAGKTLLASLIIRRLRERGLRVAPFKALNVSLNAGVGSGGEMAYAQVFQARIAGVEPEADMNPVLVKPEPGGLHVVVQGRHVATVDVNAFYSEGFQELLRRRIAESLRRLSSRFDAVVIEGTGSPTEINLPDLSNRYVLSISDARYILVSDISRGGSLAAILGTVEILGRERFAGAVLNRYSGSEELIRPAYDIMLRRYGIRILGYLPEYGLAAPWEDSAETPPERSGSVRVLVLRAPYMSNFTDVFPLYLYPDVGIAFQSYAVGGYDLYILPGSKATHADVKFMLRNGVREDLRAAVSDGSLVMGICGGLQALGRRIVDRVESGAGEFDGLGLLDAITVMAPVKSVHRSTALIERGPARGTSVRGYEIHYGRTLHRTPFETITERDGRGVRINSGAYEGRVFGTYIHDIFLNGEFTLRLINHIRRNKGLREIWAGEVAPYDDWFERIYRDFLRTVDVEALDRAILD
ncbi:MAG: cobyric acid synthase [Nitrososphaeria archaeon]